MTRREALLAGASAGASMCLWPSTPSGIAQRSPAPCATTGTAHAMTLSDVEALALQRMTPEVSGFICGGSVDALTARWNREASDRVRLRTGLVAPTGRVDTHLTLFGQALASPLLVAPRAWQSIIHPDGEVATARGARHAETVMVMSALASLRLETIAKAAHPPPWFQLDVQMDRGLTRALLQRADAAGCRVLCVTVEARTTWKDLDWLRSCSRLRMVLRGIVRPEDGERAVREQIAGVIVANDGHGLETRPAAIDALPAVAEQVAGRIPVLMDGGIRLGTDIVKALALGASAVLVGRPVLYGLAIGGASGVHRVLTILRQELEMAMASAGCSSLASINRSVLSS